MTKQSYLRLVLFTILFPITVFAQNTIELDKSSVTRGSQIVKEARKAIGTENINIDSFSLKTKFVSSVKSGGSAEVTEETSVLLPDKIRSVHYSTRQTGEFTLTSVWNAGKYKAIADTYFLGTRSVQDVTDSRPSSELTEKIDAKIGKEKVEQLKRLRLLRKDPKEEFYLYNIWQVFFPLTLIQPFEQNLEFKYVGKAKSGNQAANVVDVTSQAGNTYRLLFDSETNYLLMMIETHQGQSLSGVNGIYEAKHYFSNRKTIDNVSIPTEIKVERKFTPIDSADKEPKIFYENTDILEFSLNPEFKKDMFEIK